ncbi:MAG: methyltransferase domain-containing protein [Chloroflexota bacterium]
MDWHRRYLQQAAWTRLLREYLLAKAGISRAHRVLEVGCGTGVILRAAAQRTDGPGLRGVAVHGLDVQAEPLLQARLHVPSAHLCRGDALALPYADRSFDISFSHFLLLWVKDPLRVLQEMRRVTRRRGHVLALAEPDYSARLDHPRDLASLGQWQERALMQQGANTTIGSQLAVLFQHCEMQIIETGTIAPWRPQALTDDEFAGEWDVLREDLSGLVPETELDRMMLLDAHARRQGDRILHVPTYFVHAQV